MNKQLKRYFDRQLIRSYANKTKSYRLKLLWLWLISKNK